MLADQCLIDEINLKSVIHSYKLHWQERVLSVSLSFTKWSSHVIRCFSYFSRQFMQIKTTANKLSLIPT